MTWWGWIIAGAILLGAELSFVNAQFYLVFVGSAAILTGILTVTVAPSDWIQWAVFAALAIFSMVLFRSRVYRRFRPERASVAIGPVGKVITLSAALAAGETCQAEYGGSYWTVRNDSDAAMAPGSRARIVRVQDLTLHVRPES
jgi:inner membrane protein